MTIPVDGTSRPPSTERTERTGGLRVESPGTLEDALVIIDQLQRAVLTNRVVGIATGMLAERAHLTTAQAFAELRSLSQHHNVKLRQVARMFIDGSDAPAPATGTGVASSVSPPAVSEPADLGYIAADRDNDGALLVFTGAVSKEAVRRFQLHVPASQRPGRADLTAATFLCGSAVDLLRHLATRQTRAGARLRITVTDAVVRHQLVATGIAEVASVRSV